MTPFSSDLKFTEILKFDIDIMEKNKNKNGRDQAGSPFPIRLHSLITNEN